MEQLASLFMYMFAVSAANEQAIRLIKPAIKKWTDPPPFVYYLLASIFGITVVILCPPVALDKLIAIKYPLITYAVIGITTAGGSSVWNDLLTIITSFRTGIKQANAESKG